MRGPRGRMGPDGPTTGRGPPGPVGDRGDEGQSGGNGRQGFPGAPGTGLSPQPCMGTGVSGIDWLIDRRRRIYGTRAAGSKGSKWSPRSTRGQGTRREWARIGAEPLPFHFLGGHGFDPSGSCCRRRLGPWDLLASLEAPVQSTAEHSPAY